MTGRTHSGRDWTEEAAFVDLSRGGYEADDLHGPYEKGAEDLL